MSGKHTPEPWESKNGAEGYSHITKGTTSIASFVLPNNAKRIVQCVNACAGMEDPAKEIAELKTYISTLQLRQTQIYYLPEVPEDWEDVICFSHNYERGVASTYHPMSEIGRSAYFETCDGDCITPYAWTRIPAKPPIKEGGQP